MGYTLDKCPMVVGVGTWLYSGREALLKMVRRNMHERSEH
jgi:hypothetical protein